MKLSYWILSVILHSAVGLALFCYLQAHLTPHLTGDPSLHPFRQATQIEVYQGKQHLNQHEKLTHPKKSNSPLNPLETITLGVNSKPPADSKAMPTTANGISQGQQNELSPYLLILRKKIEAELDYPSHYQRQGMQGEVQVSLLIQPDGNLESVEVLISSGHLELDQLTLKAVHLAKPFPTLPTQKQGKLRISLPFQFKVF